MGSRLKLGAAIVGASVAMMLGVLPASADPVTAEIDKTGNVEGLRVKISGNEYDTLLFGVVLSDKTKLKTYCINLETDIDPAAGMKESPWDEYPDESSGFAKNRAKINWLLRNSYPFLGVEALNKSLGTDLDKEEAIAATQAAAWHFSDNQVLDRTNPTPQDPKSVKDVLALYDYLTGEKNVGMDNVPAPALKITPNTLAGQIGKRIGPFTVSTTASIKELTAELPAGVKLTDKDGKELTAGLIKNGTEIFVDVPASAAPGQGGFGLKASTDTSRVFVARDPAKPTQHMIVAQSESTKLSATAAATWTVATQPTTTTTTTPAPQASNGGGLANTGASIFIPAVIGLVLVGGGAGALLFLRRRGRA